MSHLKVLKDFEKIIFFNKNLVVMRLFIDFQTMWKCHKSKTFPDEKCFPSFINAELCKEILFLFVT